MNRSFAPKPLGAVHSPTVANGLVYVVTDPSPRGSTDIVRSGVLALDQATGAMKWELTTGPGSDFTEDAKGPAAVGPDGTVYVSFADCLVALNGATGAVKWKFARYPDQSETPVSECGLKARSSRAPNLGGFSDGPTVGANGVIYVPSGEGYLLAVIPPGAILPARLKWSFQTAPANLQARCDRDLRSMPAIADDGSIYVGGDDPDGKIWKINPANGNNDALIQIDPAATPTKDCNSTADTNSTPAIDQARGHVYIASDDGHLHAFNLALSQHLWSASTGSASTGTPEDSLPAINPSDGTVVIGSGDNTVYAVRSTGAVKWSTTPCPGKVVDSSAAISGNGLAVIGSLCGLFAYRISTGAVAWKFSTHQVEFSPAIGPNGTIYYPSDRLFEAKESNNESSILSALALPPVAPPPGTPPAVAPPAVAVQGTPHLTG
jgi:outer membrane protein assembly factor BamB